MFVSAERIKNRVLVFFPAKEHDLRTITRGLLFSKNNSLSLHENVL